MSSWASSGTSSTGSHITVDIGSILNGRSPYLVMDFIGEGAFGKVLKCLNVSTMKPVAIKMMEDAHWELSMLEMIRSLDPVRTNIVHFLDSFQFMVFTCLTFEMLDLSLHDLMETNEWKPLSVQEIRPVAQQMFVALDALKELGVLHADIKPDNIMLQNMQRDGLRVKLIDFGLAIPASRVELGETIQPMGYRAPEVSLGLWYSEAVDMWGLGCVLAFLYLAECLFPIDCCYQMMKGIVELLGQPDNHMLENGMYTCTFFSEVQAGDCTSWRLMTTEEFVADNNTETVEHIRYNSLPRSVDELFDIYEEMGPAEAEDRRAFLDLLKRMLHLDGTQRISPRQALQHPFVTMAVLSENLDYSSYWTTSQAHMEVCSPTSERAELAPKSSAEAPAPIPVTKTRGSLLMKLRTHSKKPPTTEHASSPSVLKRIHRFFRQSMGVFTCCIRHNVED